MATKSVFLYGKPTKIKYDTVSSVVKCYVDTINKFIEIMFNDKSYYLDLLNNNKKSPLIRGLEKNNRTALGSAYGQNAIDEAVVQLHNQFTRIKNKLYGATLNKDINLFFSSIALLNCSIMNCTYEETVEALNNLVIKAEQKLEEDQRKAREKGKKEPTTSPNLTYYQELLATIVSHGKEKVEVLLMDTNIRFFERLHASTIPFVKQGTLKLDGRLFTLEKPTTVKADSVLSMKVFGNNNRIEIPVTTSTNSARRLNQYKQSTTGTIKVLPNGQIKLAVAFVKEVDQEAKETCLLEKEGRAKDTKQPKPKKKKVIKGGDIGITDLIVDSDGNRFGSFKPVMDFYNNVVLPEQAKTNQLRNSMRDYRKELRNPKCVEERKPFLRKKIANINHMLQTNKSHKKVIRAYNHQLDYVLATAVNSYVATLQEHLKDNPYDTIITVLEELDIKEFNRSRHENRRDSMWCRGMLAKRLEEKIAWIGQQTKTVDPAYTSQLCPVCFNIDEKSRKYKDFKCTCCGHTADADHNAAGNIRDRFSDKKLNELIKKYEYNTFKRHEAIKAYYKEKNEAYLKKDKTSRKKNKAVLVA